MTVAVFLLLALSWCHSVLYTLGDVVLGSSFDGAGVNMTAAANNTFSTTSGAEKWLAVDAALLVFCLFARVATAAYSALSAYQVFYLILLCRIETQSLASDIAHSKIASWRSVLLVFLKPYSLSNFRTSLSSLPPPTRRSED